MYRACLAGPTTSKSLYTCTSDCTSDRAVYTLRNACGSCKELPVRSGCSKMWCMCLADSTQLVRGMEAWRYALIHAWRRIRLFEAINQSIQFTVRGVTHQTSWQSFSRPFHAITASNDPEQPIPQANFEQKSTEESSLEQPRISDVPTVAKQQDHADSASGRRPEEHNIGVSGTQQILSLPSHLLYISHTRITSLQASDSNTAHIADSDKARSVSVPAASRLPGLEAFASNSRTVGTWPHGHNIETSPQLGYGAAQYDKYTTS